MCSLSRDLKELADTAVLTREVQEDISPDPRYIIIRRADNKRLNGREYSGVGAAKLSIRHEFYGIRFDWGPKYFW